MKVIVDNVTGAFIEASSCSTDATLIANAKANGYANTRIVVVTDAEFAAMVKAKNAAAGVV